MITYHKSTHLSIHNFFSTGVCHSHVAIYSPSLVFFTNKPVHLYDACWSRRPTSAEFPKPSGEHPKPSGEHPKPFGEHPEPLGELPKPSGEHPKPFRELPKPSSPSLVFFTNDRINLYYPRASFSKATSSPLPLLYS